MLDLLLHPYPGFFLLRRSDGAVRQNDRRRTTPSGNCVRWAAPGALSG